MLNFGVIWKNIDILFQSLLLTLKITTVAIVLSTLLGIIVGLIASKGSKEAKFVIKIYIEVMRNIPLLVILYSIYFGLGELSINFSSYSSIIIALLLSNGAYLGEIIRAGIESINKSQTEAGLALGLHTYQLYLRVILPQALINVFPSIINQYVIILLSSSFASLVALDELTSTVSRLSSFSFRTFEFYVFGASIYLLISIAISYFSKKIDKSLKGNNNQKKRIANGKA